MNLKHNFLSVCDKIQKAQELNNSNNTVTKTRLVAISKKKPASFIYNLWQLGQKDFGENYIQEAENKIISLKNCDSINWHMTGPVQSNKTRVVAQLFQWVHTIEKLKTVVRLSHQRPQNLPALNVCIQVNIDNDNAKSGVSKDEVNDLAYEIQKLPRLNFRGIMMIPKLTDLSSTSDKNKLVESFKETYNLYKNIQHLFPNQQIDTLSMGMSKDFELAINNGSNCIRVGEALFGQRN